MEIIREWTWTNASPFLSGYQKYTSGSATGWNGKKKEHGTGENRGDQASIQKGGKFEVEQPRGTKNSEWLCINELACAVPDFCKTTSGGRCKNKDGPLTTRHTSI